MKTHITYISLLIAAGVVIFLLLHRIESERQESKSKDSIISEKNAVITYHQNKEGTLYAEKNAAVADLETLKKSYPDLIKQAVAKLNVNPKNIAMFTQTVSQVQGEGKIKIVHDTVPGSKVEVPMGDIKDGYLDLHGELVEDVFDYVKYKYTYTDTLIQAFEVKRRLFSPDVAVVKSSLSNPNAKITAETSLMVQKIKHQRFNLSVGVGYNPFQNQFYPTVSAGYALIQF